MDKRQAGKELRRALQRYRAMSHAELGEFIGEIDAHTVSVSDGTEYQIEIEALWEARTGGNICVLGSIDDGGWSAFWPLSISFIVAPDGSVVAERSDA